MVTSPREAELLQTFDLPPMDMPPQERLRQLMATRNEWKLYRRTCDATGEGIISAYSPDSPYTVYKNKIWWGDTWDALRFGREIDFSQPFFDQFFELQSVVPREGTSVFESQNCDYNSHIRHSKNCYMNSLVVRAEDMHYCYWMVDVESTLDSCYNIAGKSTLCYQCIDFGSCYQCVGLKDCYNCIDCHFSFQLRGCKNCIYCSNLSNKEYCIDNEACSKQEFEKKKAEILNGSHAQWKKNEARFFDVRANAIHRAAYLINCENVVGDHLLNSRNCENCFDGDDDEDCSNCISLNHAKDVHSCHSAGWPGCELLWNCSVSRGCIDMAFCRYMWTCSDMRYCDSCQASKHGFGCIGLQHKDFCIFNKQYSEEQFKTLRQKLIEHMKRTGEWGKYFPYQTLPFAYNESAAQDYFPLSKEEAIRKGFRWRDIEEEPPDVKKIVPADKLPDSINDIPDDILDWAIACSATGKPFRIIKQELDFYRRMRLPLPRLHPEERHRRRMAMRNPYMLWKRSCANCQNNIQTTYSPDRTEIVYCERCYLETVY